MRIELVNQTWQRFSAWERVHAIAVAYPVGFGFAVLTIVAALVRLILTVRRAH
jgi:tetrahydromethanopterin S-methyltransferase subunit B